MARYGQYKQQSHNHTIYWVQTIVLSRDVGVTVPQCSYCQNSVYTIRFGSPPFSITNFLLLLPFPLQSFSFSGAWWIATAHKGGRRHLFKVIKSCHRVDKWWLLKCMTMYFHFCLSSLLHFLPNISLRSWQTFFSHSFLVSFFHSSFHLIHLSCLTPFLLPLTTQSLITFSLSCTCPPPHSTLHDSFTSYPSPPSPRCP